MDKIDIFLNSSVTLRNGPLTLCNAPLRRFRSVTVP